MYTWLLLVLHMLFVPATPGNSDGFAVVAQADAEFWVALGKLQPAVCEGACLTAVCGWDDHKAISGSLDTLDGGLHDTCLERTCGWNDPQNGVHDECGGLAFEESGLLVEAVARLEAAVNASDGVVVADLVNASPALFALDVARGVVQVLGCGERVRAQYGISAQLAGEIEGMLGNLAD